MAAQGGWDFILMDVQMPNMSGTEATLTKPLKLDSLYAALEEVEKRNP